jgi:hypothetical protein
MMGIKGLYIHVKTPYKSPVNTASKLGPHTQTDRGTCPVWGSEFTTTKAAKKIELIQNEMAQKPMMRTDVYARALHSSQNVIRAEVWADTLRGGGVEELVLNKSFCSDL